METKSEIVKKFAKKHGLKTADMSAKTSDVAAVDAMKWRKLVDDREREIYVLKAELEVYHLKDKLEQVLGDIKKAENEFWEAEKYCPECQKHGCAKHYLEHIDGKRVWKSFGR